MTGAPRSRTPNNSGRDDRAKDGRRPRTGRRGSVRRAPAPRSSSPIDHPSLIARSESTEGREHGGPEFVVRRVRRCRTHDHQVPTRWAPPFDEQLGEGRPESATDTVAPHRRADTARGREGETDAVGGRNRWTAGANHGEPSAAGPVTGSAERAKRRTRRDPMDQAERRCRPLRRRFLRIARPARVDIRCRNPCLRARRRLFGW